MKTTPRHSPLRRTLAALLAFTMAFLPASQGAYAATTTLTDQPIAAKVAAKPNIIFTLDDSGSMAQDYSPDYAPAAVPSATPAAGYCRHTDGTQSQACGVSAALANMNPGYDEPMFASEFNRMYYNPNITYAPPADGNGNQANAAFPDGACPPNFTSTSASCKTIYKMMNATYTSNWTRVPLDMYALQPATMPVPSSPSSVYTNLTSNFSMPVFCNTDWPRGAGTNGVGAINTAALMLPLVANSKGEYLSTAGADCRINGTSYDALDGAPAIDIGAGATGYNYPWARSSGAVDPKYYSRLGGNRAIYCDKTAALWPKSCYTDYITCSGTVTVTPPVAQTCNFVNNTTTSGAPYTYLPTGCESDPVNYQFTWSGGGCVGTIGVECLACNRTGTTIITGKHGTCSVTGANCDCSGAGCTLPACPDYNPPDLCSGTWSQTCNPAASATCNTKQGTTTGATGSPSLLDDANGAGTICRRNNMAAYGSTRFTYPSGVWTTTINDSSCGAIASTVSIPRYYYVAASVQFCDKQITQSTTSSTAVASPNDQWRGFGTGTCQQKNDLTTYKFVKYGQLKRVGLVNDGRTYPYVDPFTEVAGARTYAEEMTNYANWYAYYRTRVLTAKTTTAIAFLNVDKTYRAGLQTLNLRVAGNTQADWLDIADFTPANRLAWYNKLFGLTIVAGMQTPTIDAMIRVGELVKAGSGAVTGLPTHTDPFPINPATSQPVTCTNNYHVLFTDGATNQATLPTVVGEVDGSSVPGRVVNGTLPPDPGPSEPTRSLSGLNALVGSPWPLPYRDVASATPNTLADISLYYWDRDLRSDLKNDVPSSDGTASKDLDWKRNPAWWQHVSFSALSYGSDGLLESKNSSGVVDITSRTDEIAAGTVAWFTAPNYPRPPNRPNVPVQTPATRPATAIDDLWHATVNSRGTYAYAETPIEIAYGFGRIISGIGNNPKARVGVTFASPQLHINTGGGDTVATNDFVYSATIGEGWSGDVKKVTVDTETGEQGATRWSAAAKLDDLLKTPTVAPALDTDNKWYAERRVVTRNVDSGAMVPFLYDNIGALNQSRLGTTTDQQKRTIAYLRGGSTVGDGASRKTIEGIGIGQYRQRTSKLGNISDSKPVVVGPPIWQFNSANDYGYEAYQATHASRALRLYVGANDGMFHVFDGTDDASTGGTEVFAYVPSGVINNAVDEGGKPKGIRALTFQDGGSPIFKHHFYVNASPKTMDVDFANCGSNTACAPDWRTIVVGGLGKGGNTYFAIDATINDVTTEASAAAKVLWEWQLPNSEFSFGKPIIGKTRADGWVVVIASGYNNTDDGKGHLYFLKASDGTLIRKLDTVVAEDPGTVANPSGLAQISGFVKDWHNQTIEQIYGGDLNGNVWRWDVSAPSAGAWTVKRLASLVAPSAGGPQPVTTAPQIEIDLNNGVDRYVFVGTGRLLDPSDLTYPTPEQVQTMYAMRDGTLETPGSSVIARGDLMSASGVAGAGAVAPNGWYNDLPVGQRIVTDPVAEFNVVAYVAVSTQPDPCLTSLPARVYGRDYTTGESLVYDDTNTLADNVYVENGAVGLEMIAMDKSGSTFPELKLVTSSETNSTIKPIKITPKSFGGGHRLSWRLLGE